MAIALDLSPDYGWVLLCATVMGFSILVIGFVIPGRARGQVFTEQYMKQNFGAEHLKAFGTEIQKGGYPDMGSGLYSRNLTYEQWFNFNSAQRAHQNYLQWIATSLVLLLIAGIYFPVPAAAIGLGIIICRFIYAIGYFIGGPKGRLIGVLGNDLLVLAQFVLAFISSVYFIKNMQY